MHDERAIAKTKSPTLPWKLVVRSLVIFVGAGLGVLSPLAFAQETQSVLARPQAYYKVVPLTGVSDAAIGASVAAATTIPMWRYSITSSRDGKPYTGVMVGRSPFFHGARTTKVPTFIKPAFMRWPRLLARCFIG